MKMRHIYTIICLLATLTACDKGNVPPEPNIQQGDPLVFPLTRTGGNSPAPAGDYGLFAVDHINEIPPISWNPPPATFYDNIENVKGTMAGNELTFYNGSNHPYRYPINNWLSVFLYYPYNVSATPTNIPVDRNPDKYPDYLAGQKAISVIAGTPEDVPKNTIVPLKHLMARVRFQIENPGVDAITLSYVKLNGIAWKGTIHPQIPTSNGFFVPSESPIDLDIIKDEGVTIEGTPMGNPVVPQYIPIDPKYNYSDMEAAAADADYYDPTSGYGYYILVPPLKEDDLNEITLEITVNRSGNTTIETIEMKQLPEIATWEPGKSYRYTIIFSSFPIEEVYGTIEEWQEDLFIGEVDLFSSSSVIKTKK